MTDRRATDPTEAFAELAGRPVTALRGISGQRATQLEKLGIVNWLDLATFFPRDYQDWSQPLPLADLVDGEEQAFLATVARRPTIQRKGRLSMVRTVLRDEQSAIAAIWFNQPYLADKLVVGRVYRFFGKVRRQGRIFSIQNPLFEIDDPADWETATTQSSLESAFRPIYPLTAGIGQGMLRQWIRSVLDPLLQVLPETLPDQVRRTHRLCSAAFAYERIHRPHNRHDIEISRRRLAFEELFLLQSGLYLLRRRRTVSRQAFSLAPGPDSRNAIESFVGSLPFRLTGAQARVWNEIRDDLAQGRPMNRLLQGDVGSGKTVVAALAMLQCALAGKQAVMMAPTAILARQHHRTLNSLLEKSGWQVGLLTGSVTGRARREIRERLADGSLRLVVGTHALLESDVQLPDLALAITDEQHRFGVRQRVRLISGDNGGDSVADSAGVAGSSSLAGQAQPIAATPPQMPIAATVPGAAATRPPDQDPAQEPHVLVMSATPIPRSLALVLYGDLDLSLIDELPAGRQPIETYTAGSQDRSRVEALMRRYVSDGRQVYVVCPMIEETEALDLESVLATYSRLAQTVFPDLRVGLIHGGLKAAAKDDAMDRFLSGQIDILVSTTVIEVGIDNPNAALMIIENAERFGLAQLHQLRGRIGRGAHRSICVLFSDSDDDLARERLRALCRSNDGYAVAERDLELRGPGDFFGTRQHGLPALRIANLYRDRDLLVETRRAVAELTAEDPDLAAAPNRIIRRQLNERFGASFRAIGL